MKLISRDSGKILARVLTAETFLKRVFGLAVGKPLDYGQCFLIKGCRSIHTIGMRYSIDAVFLNGEGRVVRVYEGLKPYRVTPFLKKAESVVEFKAGFVRREGIMEGLCLGFV
ncbi:MAG: DUF192 domain-containing protein [Actinomycetota bacterium]